MYETFFRSKVMKALEYAPEMRIFSIKQSSKGLFTVPQRNSDGTCEEREVSARAVRERRDGEWEIEDLCRSGEAD
jgi:hypothetical protein